MYILGDIYVVELEIFLSRAFTCLQASLFTLFRALYSELLNEFEQVALVETVCCNGKFHESP